MPRLLPVLLALCLVAGPAAAAPPGETRAAPKAPATEPLRLPRIALHGDALGGKPRSLSVDELDALAPATTWQIRDPYRGRDNHYSGILLRDLVKTLAPQARRVRMRAVNDYITWFERREWETLPILLATRDEGARMSVADKGPARIVYQQTADNELQMQVHAPKWIWQVVDVEFIGN